MTYLIDKMEHSQLSAEAGEDFINVRKGGCS